MRKMKTKILFLIALTLTFFMLTASSVMGADISISNAAEFNAYANAVNMSGSNADATVTLTDDIGFKNNRQQQPSFYRYLQWQ
jgi:5-bromo-4-chloroindolyl phosphate hydrolysis protein